MVYINDIYVNFRYFKEYSYPISVMFTAPHLSLSDTATRDKVLGILSELESTPYIDGNVTSCWLRDFLGYVRRAEGWICHVTF